MIKQNIAIISYGHFEIEFLIKIAEAAKSEFKCPVNIGACHIDLNEFYDPDRRQYNATGLLKDINTRYYSESTKTIGVFRVDLFIPILTYIFGQAYLGGKSGIVSSYRLYNEHYGLKPNEKLLMERFKKEIIHELGHTFGLVHCHIPTCVMRSSTYVEDIDQKSKNLCPACSKAIGL